MGRTTSAVDQFRPSSRRRQLAAATLTTTLTAVIAGMFWWQDLQFARPTPVPEGWQAIAPGAPVVLPGRLEQIRNAAGNRPVLLHFFNPSCPCSRFNVDHVRALARSYGDRVTFVAVLVQGDAATLTAAYRTLGLDVPYYVDDGQAANAVGAYSTPQAAILDSDGRLVYRGNYNVTRYCRERETEFARIALDDMLAGRPARTMPSQATVAYGCPLRHPRGTGGDGA